MRLPARFIPSNYPHDFLKTQENFIGADYSIAQDLTSKLPEDWRAFNREFIPIYQATHPDKTKIAAGLACGALWTIAKGIRKGDMVLCPDGSGTYHVGEVNGDYYYSGTGPLPHRRPVHWLDQSIDRTAMSDALRASTTSWTTVCDISGYRDEIEKLLEGHSTPTIVSTDPSIEDPAAFASRSVPSTELGADRSGGRGRGSPIAAAGGWERESA
jgi:restriction system protein